MDNPAVKGVFETGQGGPSLALSGRPLRIALVITELAPGGAERCLVELATRLDRARFTPIVCSLGPEPPPGRQSLIRRLQAAAIKAHFLDLTRPWQYFRGVRRLAALFRGEQPDIVQTFLFHANVIGARAALKAHVPHVITGIRVADPRRWRARVERWATRHADRIVCVSGDVAQFALECGFAPQKLAVIPNGIDVAAWKNAQPADLTKFGVPPGRRVFVYIGRLDEQKGLDQLFDELPLVFNEISSHDLLVVGEGRQHDSLKRTALRLGISNRIHFAGWQPEIPPILAASDLLVLPSRWEGMPNVILEAMAAGKPVLAARAQGVAELIASSKEQIFDLGQRGKAAERLVLLLRNSSLRKELGESNLARVARHFSMNSIVDSYGRLYSSLAAK